MISKILEIYDAELTPRRSRVSLEIGLTFRLQGMVRFTDINQCDVRNAAPRQGLGLI